MANTPSKILKIFATFGTFQTVISASFWKLGIKSLWVDSTRTNEIRRYRLLAKTSKTLPLGSRPGIKWLSTAQSHPLTSHKQIEVCLYNIICFFLLTSITVIYTDLWTPATLEILDPPWIFEKRPYLMKIFMGFFFHICPSPKDFFFYVMTPHA